jgi:hypothetical protein
LICSKPCNRVDSAASVPGGGGFPDEDAAVPERTFANQLLSHGH